MLTRQYDARDDWYTHAPGRIRFGADKLQQKRRKQNEKPHLASEKQATKVMFHQRQSEQHTSNLIESYSIKFSAFFNTKHSTTKTVRCHFGSKRRRKNTDTHTHTHNALRAEATKELVIVNSKDTSTRTPFKKVKDTQHLPLGKMGLGKRYAV